MKIPEIYEVFKKYPNIITNSKDIVPNSIFVALKGTHDGNGFVNDALENGACYAIADNKSFVGNEKVIVVDNVLKTLQNLAVEHRKQLRIPTLAITGSNGKTTTRELVYHVLHKKFQTVVANEKNTLEGVPRFLLKTTLDNNFLVIEMGTDFFGNIKTLCEIANPNFGLITNIGEAHTEFLKKEMGGVARAKGEMFEFLAENNGMAFVNSDIYEVSKIAKKILKTENIITYNAEQYNIIKLPPNKDYYFQFIFNGTAVTTKLAGNYNFENVLAAIAIGKYFVISEPEIIEAIELYTPNNYRSQIKDTDYNKLIIDSYNANPTSMNASLQDFIGWKTTNKMLILGDMLEIENSDSAHLQIIETIISSDINEVLLVGDCFARAALDTKFLCFKNAEKLITYLERNKITNRNILLKGSNSILGKHLAEIEKKL